MGMLNFSCGCMTVKWFCRGRVDISFKVANVNIRKKCSQIQGWRRRYPVNLASWLAYANQLAKWLAIINSLVANADSMI